MFDVISIGSATVDFFLNSSSFGPKSIKIPLGAKIDLDSASITSGGGATNSAVAFSRLGLKSAPVCLYGQDPLSHYIDTDLRQNQVDTSLVRRLKKESTDYAAILLAPNGSRSILVNRGPSRLEQKHISWSKIKSTKWLYLTSLEGNLDLLEKIVGFAQENQINLALNPGGRELNQPNRLIPLLSAVHLLLLNQTEAEILTSASFDSRQFWSKIKSFGCLYVAVTRGRHGAHLISHQNLYSPIIDTTSIDDTGAGDAFGSTLTAALLYQQPPETALFWAIKNSASVVSQIGAKPGLLTLKQLQSS